MPFSLRPFLLCSVLAFLSALPATAAQNAPLQANEAARGGGCRITSGANLDVESCYRDRPGAGAKILACLDEVNRGVYPVGTVCDARGLINEGHIQLGETPIEIGARVHEELLMPNIGNGVLQTSAHLLPTPPAPQVTATAGKGYAAGSYYFRVNYRTGDGVSASSPEATATATDSMGRFAVALPKCPTFATSVDITASSAAGQETLQGNGICGSVVTLAASVMSVASAAAPTVATPVPAIILHSETKSEIYADRGAQAGFFFVPDGHSFAASNFLATTGNGYSLIKDLGFYNNTNVPGIIANVYDVSCYASCVRDHLFISAGDNSVGYKLLGQYNDVKLFDPNFVCIGRKNVTPFEILATPGSAGWGSMDTESIHAINIFGGLIGCLGAGNTGPAVVIQGRSNKGLPSAAGLPTALSSVAFWGTAFELGNQKIGVEIQDAQNVLFEGVFSTDDTRTPDARFVQIDSTGVTGAGFPTASQIHISKGSSIAWPVIVANNVTGQRVEGNRTNAYNKAYDFGGGDDRHANFANNIQSEADLRDANSPLLSHAPFTELPSTEATAEPGSPFTADLTAGSRDLAHLSTALARSVAGQGLSCSTAGVLAPGTVLVVGQDAAPSLSQPALKSATGLTCTPFTATNGNAGSFFEVQASTVVAANSPKLHAEITSWRTLVMANKANSSDPGTTFTLAPFRQGNGDAGPHSWEIRGLNAGSTGGLYAAADVGLFPPARPQGVQGATTAPALTFYDLPAKGPYTPGCAFTPTLEPGTAGRQHLTFGGDRCLALQSTVAMQAPALGSGSLRNTDLAGELTLNAGRAQYTFAGHYTHAPLCTASDTTAPQPLRVQTSPTTLQLTGTNADTLNYICIVRE